MPILMALFAIKIVANNFLGRSRSLTTIDPFAVLPSSISLTSVGESPNKATSAPEIKAEQQSSNNKTMTLSAKAPSKTIKFGRKLRGSGSNSYDLNFDYLKW